MLHLHMAWFAFKLHFTQVDQTVWTSQSYNNCLFGAVTTTDQEETKHGQKAPLIDWPGRKTGLTFSLRWIVYLHSDCQ